MSSKTAVNIVFGAMTLGKEGSDRSSISILCNTNNPQAPSKHGEAGQILDTFTRYGHNEIDTARTCGGGSSEEYLGQLDWQTRGILMDTIFSPRHAAGASGIVMNHSP